MKSNKTKIVLLFIALFVLIGGGLVLYTVFAKNKNAQQKNAVSEEVKKETEKKDAELAKSNQNKNSQTSENEKQQSTDQASPVAISISSLGQAGQTVFVNSLVSGATSGTCSLTLQNGSTKITKTANVGLQVSYYICQGFSISASEFVPKGEWSAFIDITTSNGNARSEIKKVDVL